MISDKVSQSKKWYVLCMFFCMFFFVRSVFLNVRRNGRDQKHVLCLFYVCSMYVLI